MKRQFFFLTLFVLSTQLALAQEAFTIWFEHFEQRNTSGQDHD